VVIKQGDHGATVFDREKNILQHIHPYPANVKDLTGAGDSFCGGFTIGYAQSKDSISAALFGTVSASYIIEGFGGLHALEIDREMAEERLKTLKHLHSL
jgi:sugar/nucleoside kinase (ribokinase family)